MPIIGSFNQWNIIQMPSTPGWESVQPSYRNSVGVNTSPFTQQSQTYNWPGSDLWVFHAKLPPMTYAQAAPWLGWLHELQGQANAFLASMAYQQAPMGAGGGTPVVSSAGPNTAMTNQLTTSGWPENTNVLMVGDFIQVGIRLYMLAEDGNTDASGNVTLTVFPSLRETPATGAPVIYEAPQGLFRLAKPAAGWSINEVGIHGMEFDFMEAR